VEGFVPPALAAAGIRLFTVAQPAGQRTQARLLTTATLSRRADAHLALLGPAPGTEVLVIRAGEHDLIEPRRSGSRIGCSIESVESGIGQG
jgi:hypothetical protein